MWECQKCGACCRSDGVRLLMPTYWNHDKKQCKYLNDNNMCDIYDTRPQLCRTMSGFDYTVMCKFLRQIYNTEE